MPTEAWSWIHLVVRWTHVFAAILWIGQTNLFGWMDRVFHRQVPGVTETENGDEIWMVHSGGFYQVKKVIVPDQISDKLHWFKWEAGMTWLSGIALIFLVYVRGGTLWDYEYVSGLEVDPGLGLGMAVAMGILAIAFVGYTALIHSPVGKSDLAMAAVCLVASMGGFHLMRAGHLSDRAAFLMVAACFGTIMAGSVWMKIVPVQRRNIARIAKGEDPDQDEAAAAGRRSKHNSYLVYPVVIFMLSTGHFPTITYSGAHATAVIGGLIVVGWIASAIVKRLG